MKKSSAIKPLASLALLGLSLFACGRDTGPDPDATAIPVGNDGKTIAATKDGITAYIMSGDYLGWVKEPAIRPTLRAHGTLARSYYNSKYIDARHQESYPMQPGAMAIKELYNDTTVYGYSVSVKTKSGTAAETWTWYETTGLPDVKYFGVANPTCEGCHSADGGRDRSLATTVP